jgi:GIY-YIG catalytic domain
MITTTNGFDRARSELLEPRFLRNRLELVANRRLVPAATGVYAWYARTDSLPESVIAKHTWRDWSLINVGKSRVGRTDGLQRRIAVAHCKRDAGHSQPFRLLLGKILQGSLGLRLLAQQHRDLVVKAYSGHRKPWPESECRLDAWLDDNAAVTWTLTEEEDRVENSLIWEFLPPCNHENNRLWEQLKDEIRALGVTDQTTLCWGTA